MSIFVTGDIHGNPSRFSSDIFYEGKDLTKADVVEILGDFGLVWSQTESPAEQFHLDWLNNKPWTTVATLGNHENYDRIATLPVEEHFGGPVWVLRPSIFLLQSGYIYEICGKKIWNFNGARSHDISDGILDPEDPQFEAKIFELERNFKYMWRVKNRTWWAQEVEQDPEVYARGIRNLEAVNYDVDFVWTHCCPTRTAWALGFSEKQDRLCEYFQEIDLKLPEKTVWFFGHYHQNKTVEYHRHCLYEQIIQIA